MSYELSFHSHSNYSITARSVIKYFRSKRHFKTPWFARKEFQIWYNNKDTGVYFLFEYQCPYGPTESGGAVSAEDNFTGFSFILNYGRPSFFAYEAMPIVEDFQNEFDLLISDPQVQQAGSSGLSRYSAEQLTETWKKGNIAAVQAQKMLKIPTNYMSEEKATNWWRYSKEKTRLKKQLSGGVFVPSILIVAEQSQKELATAIRWTAGKPQLFPPTDYIVLFKSMQDLHKPDARRNLRPSARVYSAIEHLTEPFDDPVADTRILKADKLVQAKKLFPSLLTQDFTFMEAEVTPDAFVDVK